jgi:hypothetical protein
VQVLMLAASALSVRFIPTDPQAVKTYLTDAIILEPTYMSLSPTIPSLLSFAAFFFHPVSIIFFISYILMILMKL